MVRFIQYEYEGVMYEIKIGRNSKQNWEVVTQASPNDMWFHLGGDLPSCHVILANPDDKELSPHIIKYCSNLCKSNTNKFKNENDIQVIYSKIKYIKLGEKEGQVYTIPSHTRTIII